MLRRWLPLLAVAALLATVFLAAALADPQFAPRPLPSESAEPEPGASASTSTLSRPPEETPAAPPASFALPAWVEAVLTWLCLGIVVAVAAVLAWFALRGTAQPRGRPITTDTGARLPQVRDELAAALDEGLAALATDGADPRSVVISCWVRLEDAAAAAGTPRQPADAPGDYVLRLLAGHAVSRPVLDRFADLYRQARYSSGPVDDGMRGSAVGALQLLRAELDTPVRPPAPAGEAL